MPNKFDRDAKNDYISVGYDFVGRLGAQPEPESDMLTEVESDWEGMPHQTIIAIAVCVPVIVLLLLAIGLWLFCKRRIRHRHDNMVSPVVSDDYQDMLVVEQPQAETPALITEPTNSATSTAQLVPSTSQTNLVVSGVRALAGYAVVIPLGLGAIAALLLAANIAASYWFQRRRRRRQERAAFGRGRGPKKAMLGVDPPVARIRRLGFAARVPQAVATTLFPTGLNGAGWVEPIPELSMDSPMVGQELVAVGRLVVRDFVEAWFGDVSADKSFPRSVLAQIVLAADAVAERARGNDTAALAVGQLLPLATAHVHAAREGEAAMRTHPALRGTGDSEGDRKRAVMGHVRRVVDLVVPLVLPVGHSSFGPHRVLVRELITGALVAPALISLADPDTINQLLDAQLERLIREQHMIHELRGALDQQARTPPAAGDDPVRTYEQFMTIIDECASVGELERIHEDVLAQIRKRRILIMGQNKDDIVHGQRVRDILVYINRLYVAKKKAERRLDMLRRDQDPTSQPTTIPQSSPAPMRPPALLSRGAHPSASRVSTYYEHRDDPAKLGPPQFTLREILTNVSSLSAFAEYMDLIGGKFMLEFWLNVEGVRPAPQPLEIFPNIVGSLWKSYFTLRVDELAAVGSEVEAAISRVQRCLKPHRISGALDLDLGRLTEPLCVEAFELICLVQRSVFRHMEASVFPPFLRSAFYSRFLKEYYVTPHQDHVSAALFASAELAPLPEEPVSPDTTSSFAQSDTSAASAAKKPRRISVSRIRSLSRSSKPHPQSRKSSLTRSVTESLDPPKSSFAHSLSESLERRKSSLAPRSGDESLVNTVDAPLPVPKPRRWNPAQRARPDAPVVSTTTSEALARDLGSGSSRSSMLGLSAVMAADRPVLPANVPRDSPSPLATSQRSSRRQSVRVDRSEVRRLSASLRSIGLGEAGATERALGSVSAINGPIAEESSAEEAEEDQDVAAEAQETADSTEGSLSSEDEAESLVLARVVKTAAPGDLFLPERLARLAADLERKAHQMAIVRALMRQARSRHLPHEQRVLRASFRGLRRELHTALEQQRLYECALDAHCLAPEHTRISIPHTVEAEPDVDAEPDARRHVVYQIEIQQTVDVAAPVTWVVGRRYREFYAMHQSLKAAHPAEMRSHELPSRTPLLRLQKDRDVEQRRLRLERYLQSLLADGRLCSAVPVRLFLTSTAPPNESPASPEADAQRRPLAGWMEQIYKTVGEDIEGITGASSMLEIIVQELGAQVAMQQQPNELTANAAETDESSALFVDPLSDLFIEIFGLKNRRNWLRRQAISVLLRHIFGGAVERRVRLLVDSVMRDQQLGGLLGSLRESLWPSTKTGTAAKFQGFKRRTPEQKSESRERAQAHILWYVPRLLASMVGRKNSRDGASLLFESFQNPQANLNLVLLLFDQIVTAIFPEIKYQLEHA
ncbi:tRNA (guanine-N(7)-)-methyltransferase (tRNA(m7G46)-methyltransferase) [Coemansia sp. RSA 552]|nr:tRNA (guanine-N(7)-)-methyltransferase (tRNA(m7G46)-methyltransferase) [Coemansia sp. RSA 552]